MKKHTPQDKAMPNQALASQPTDNLDTCLVSMPYQVLTVPIVALMLSKNRSQAHIARTFNKSPQAVNDFIKRHRDQLGELCDYETVVEYKAKHQVLRGLSSLDGRDLKKDRLGDVNNLIGTMYDKVRLQTNQSTQNIAYQDVSAPVKALDEDIARLQAQIAELQATETTNKRVKRITSDNVIDVSD